MGRESLNQFILGIGKYLKLNFVCFCAGTSDVSISISPNGWAWLVHGRRLVIWRYTRGNLTSSSGRSGFASVSANCRELTLPPSDLAHNAKLVNVFAVNENQTPSCIAVSPEGKFSWIE